MSTKREKKAIAKLKKRAKNPGGIKRYIKKNADKMSLKMTWPEREFKKLLSELNVVYEIQKIVNNKIFDFYIPKLNLLVEVDGCYYHANPEKFTILNSMQKRNKKNDVYKNNLAAGLGFGIERVWESDLKEKYEEVKLRFKKILN